MNTKNSSAQKPYFFIDIFTSSASWMTLIIPPIVLGILTTLFYIPSLFYPFQFDDLASITKFFELRNYSFLKGILHGSRWIGESFNALAFNIGRFDPFYYRVSSLFIHLAAGIILFYLIFDLCRHVVRSPFLKENALLIASLTSGLFLLHPVQTQTVSYVIQARLEGLATLFILSALLVFVKALRAHSLVGRSALFALCGLISFFACGTKEIVVVIPFLAVLIDWFFIAEESWDIFKGRLLVYVLLAVLVIGTLLFFLDMSFVKQALTLSLEVGNNRGNILTSHAYIPITAGAFFISQFKVLVHYLSMFLMPSLICAEYDWKLSQGFFSADVIFPLLFLMLLFGIAFYFMLRKKQSVYSFGLFWFLISVAPRSSIIPSPELLCDYKAYLASAGIYFVLAVFMLKTYIWFFQGASQVSQQSELTLSLSKGHQAFAVLLICCMFGWNSYERNKVWKDPIAFWHDIVEKQPGKARAHNNLGVSYAEKGKTEEAIVCYQEAIRLDQHYTDPYNNLAVAYTRKEDIDNAIVALDKAIALFPHYPEAFNNRGSLLTRKKQFDLAKADLEFAIKLRPHYGKAFYNLGRLYFEQGDRETAWTYFKKATQVDLDDAPQAYHTLGQLSLMLNKFEDAVESFEQMVKILQTTAHPEPIFAEALFSLGNSYFMTKRYDAAQQLFVQLSKQYPLEARYIHNLAETLFTKGQFQEALQAYSKAASVPQSMPQSYLRIANCFENLQQLDKAQEYLEQLLKVEAPEEFKKKIKTEIARITIQSQLNTNNGQLKLSDLSKAVLPLQNKQSAEASQQKQA